MFRITNKDTVRERKHNTYWHARMSSDVEPRIFALSRYYNHRSKNRENQKEYNEIYNSLINFRRWTMLMPKTNKYEIVTKRIQEKMEMGAMVFGNMTMLVHINSGHIKLTTNSLILALYRPMYDVYYDSRYTQHTDVE
jgi:hypothetical protein